VGVLFVTHKICPTPIPSPHSQRKCAARGGGEPNTATDLPVRFEAGEKEVILPDAVDAQVLAGETLTPEAVFLQEPD
jgi:hypothetical protein